jgi:peptidoglycan-N-acetylglucosamine deacetylase
MGMVVVFHSITRGNQNKQICAFTFDDGPSKLPLEAWLEALEQLSAPGTFFFTGEWIDKHPDQARMILARGHELASHSYHHRRMSQIPKEVFFEELKESELAYQEATGRPSPNFMRFPYLNYNEENLSWLSELGYYSVAGDDTKDWSGLPAQDIIENGLKFLYNGSILVFHSNDIAQETPKAVKQLARAALKNDLKPVKVSDMLNELGIATEYRSWKISIEVPLSDSNPPLEWTKIQSSEDIQKLAAETLEWRSDKIPAGDGAESQWIQQLSQPLKAHNVIENRELFVGLMKADEFWGYARFGVKDEELIILDFGFREAQADTLVYLLRWAVKIGKELGCSTITASQDMRRMHKMCQQMGWKSFIEFDELRLSPVAADELGVPAIS